MHQERYALAMSSTRRLILLRHGEAEWQPRAGTDRDRHLTRAGQDQAATIAERLVARGWAPDKVVTSPAIRARDTARAVADVCGAPLIESATLYGGSVGDVQHEVIAPVGGDVQTLLLVGHNPIFSSLASALTSVRVSMGTANAVLLGSGNAAWDDAAYLDGAWSLHEHLVP
jgi:polyadenylate-binding protein